MGGGGYPEREEARPAAAAQLCADHSHMAGSLSGYAEGSGYG
jgi:hypothetical protein